MWDFNKPATLMKAHPVLFPYGCGGLIEAGDGLMQFIECAWWCLLYGDKWF
jgi:hypothetical protein